jgi:uncharacterized protein YjbJ (UPF0337 family)
MEKLSRDIIRGEAERIKGKARSAYGKITGSLTQRAKGRYEQTKGTIRKKIGKAKYRI